MKAKRQTQLENATYMISRHKGDDGDEDNDMMGGLGSHDENCNENVTLK